MTSNPPSQLTFTGSTEIGKSDANAPHGEKNIVELGGTRRSSCSTTRFGRAVQGAIASKYRNTGQLCLRNRLLCRPACTTSCEELEPASEMARWATAAASLTKASDRCQAWPNREHIAEPWRRPTVRWGKRHALGGTFFEPHPDPVRQDAVAREETFGPVAPLFRI